MDILTQSTFLPVRVQDLWIALAARPRIFPLGRSNPSLVYLAREPWKLGALVDIQLHFGVYKLEWLATVSAFSAEENRLELRLAQTSFIHHFHSEHRLISFGDDCSILRESVQFYSNDPNIRQLLSQARLMHAIQERVEICDSITNRKTSSFFAIGNSASA